VPRGSTPPTSASIASQASPPTRRRATELQRPTAGWAYGRDELSRGPASSPSTVRSRPSQECHSPSIQTQRNGSRALSGPRLLSNPQAARMERLWSPAGATSGKHRQISRPSKPRDQAKSVAVGCDWLPRVSNGKEGVDGSSPSEGSAKSRTAPRADADACSIYEARSSNDPRPCGGPQHRSGESTSGWARWCEGKPG
jgi:hypothetical protein